VAYPFGFGLSYTSFSYSDMMVTSDGVSLTVKNEGDVDAAEIVQMYVSLPGAKVFRPEKRDTKVELVDSTKNNSVTLNVDIFADGIIGSYYILWDEVDLSEDIKKMMTTRDFARDEFFMQNIDREQFEQERLLQLFEDKKKEYFAIFPEEALKMIEDQKKDE